MDTKWKNSRKKRIKITMIALCLLSLVNVCVFPFMRDYILRDGGIQVEEEEGHIRESVARWLYKGSYVLYYEHMVSTGQTDEVIADFYFPDMTGEEMLQFDIEASDKAVIESRLNQWVKTYEEYRDRYDYYAVGGNDGYCNTEVPIEVILESSRSDVKLAEAFSQYKHYFALCFDEQGNMEVKIEQCEGMDKDDLLKHFQGLNRTECLKEAMSDVFDTNVMQPRKITSFTVVYGIPYDIAENQDLVATDYYSRNYYYVTEHIVVRIGYGVNMIFLFILMLLMTNQKIWDNTITFTRHGRQYLMEVALFLGVPFVIAFSNLYGEMVESAGGTADVMSLFTEGGWELLFGLYMGVLGVFACVYLTFLYIRPLFSLGLTEYIHEYSLCYRIWIAIKRCFGKIVKMIKSIDLEQKSTKTIIKFVVIQFVILAVLMCMWVMGLFGLVLYSIALVFFLNKYYSKVVADYQKALGMTRRIAQGDFQQASEEDFGLFNSMKTELGKIESGFQKAVEEETKSQRMKTELITNVSHDLKTPLTAITTYVELLKKEDITEEERKEYIDTLARKSMRLKVLIEDLFEVSKASSQNIVLNYMDVDVVNLMKQVYIEHEEKLAQMGLDIRWNIVAEKLVLRLDSQKTYRIFENLFVNIQKYALPNSRVYIDVLSSEDRVQIVMKNISATELNVRPEELTERFVRGDQSRNTEGSGLGLAIAKSFTEAQKGSFEVFVDGDLFKVVISFKKNHML